MSKVLRWHPAYRDLKRLLRAQVAKGGRIPDFCHTTIRSYDKQAKQKNEK